MNTNRHRTATSRREFLQASTALGGLLAATPSAAAVAPARSVSSAAGEKALLPRSLHPYPNRVTWGDGMLILDKRVALAVGRDCEAGVVEMMRETWRRFTFGAVELAVTRDAALPAGGFTLAGGRPPRREANATYALAVDATGIAAEAGDVAAVRQAWFTLLQLLQARDDLSFAVPHVAIQDWPALPWRGLHLCIFRETPPVMIEKAIRLAALLKFTHVVLELMTTWHHLAQSIPLLPEVAACAWSEKQAALGLRQAEGSLSRAATASLLRRLVPAEGRFEGAGWNPFELPAEID